MGSCAAPSAKGDDKFITTDYLQQCRFNYYGTVGSNRDEFIMIRKMKNIAWLDDEGRDQVQEAKK
ncbi:hypothetical protein K9I87_04215 [Klebsiella pneumoniae]|nr:hypothetical protein [Klebsiella pneumoniae]MCZ9574030.1 hypothetical protein [Klebsiella pneumoniae]